VILEEFNEKFRGKFLKGVSFFYLLEIRRKNRKEEINRVFPESKNPSNDQYLSSLKMLKMLRKM
jgi:preprotein translocase subunit Sss1